MTTAEPISPPAPPAGYTVRRPTMDDVDGAYAVVTASDIEDYGDVDFSRDDLVGEWKQVNLETDGWVVEDANGRIAGWAALDDRAKAYFDSNVITHPEHRGRGIASHLLTLVEQRADERMAEAPEGARVVLGTFTAAVNKPAIALLESRGYTEARHFWRMSIQMTDEPDAPEWPEGISVRSFVKGEDERATYEASMEAFQDHWGSVRRDFEKWVQRTETPHFDPTLWFLAMDGDEVAGFSLCGYSSETPWVETLGVRRPWRQRGLGLALLLHSFGELWRRGARTVALGVDSQNLTGATRLYERAGMKADRDWIRFEKELRPGRDLATTSL